MKTKTSFSKTRQPDNEAKRKPKRKTILKEAILSNPRYKEIEDAKGDVLEFYAELFETGSKTEKAFAAKEISKYLFPTKQNVETKHTGDININLNGIPKV